MSKNTFSDSPSVHIKGAVLLNKKIENAKCVFLLVFEAMYKNKWRPERNNKLKSNFWLNFWRSIVPYWSGVQNIPILDGQQIQNNADVFVV